MGLLRNALVSLGILRGDEQKGLPRRVRLVCGCQFQEPKLLIAQPACERHYDKARADKEWVSHVNLRFMGPRNIVANFPALFSANPWKAMESMNAIRDRVTITTHMSSTQLMYGLQEHTLTSEEVEALLSSQNP